MLMLAEARLNITYGGQNGDLNETVPWDASDNDIKQWAAEAVRNDDIPGIDAVDPDFGDFVVDRFEKVDDLPNRVLLRPKTPFGAGKKQAQGKPAKMGKKQVGAFVFGPDQDKDHPWVQAWQKRKDHKVVIKPTHAELHSLK